ncbi:MAG: acetaldehyde dehydrogenase (acetylating) [Pseudomonadota bacterium]
MAIQKVKCAIIGTGNIGTDLMVKIVQTSKVLELAAFVGIDPKSDGLARAEKMGISGTSEGLVGLTAMDDFEAIKLVFDATSAGAHRHHHDILSKHGKQLVDLTPAAIGPYTVPVVNMDEHLGEQNVNMVTCGGQATIPIVHAVSRVAKVHYAEIVASVSSRSAGPGTRANIDEFTQTTARAIESVGGAERGKAIIILNPAEPPMIMRDTIFTLSERADESAIERSVADMIADVQSYVPGYRLKQQVQFEHFNESDPLHIPGFGDFSGTKSSVFLEVEGAAHYLPAYAGNLDIMTSAALGTAERLAQMKFAAKAA